jgi:hypothetical protein
MSEPVQACLCLVLCAAVLWVILGGRRAVWPTTLRAMWCWAVLTLIALASVEMVLGFSAGFVDSQAELLRFATAVLVFTPTMAVLGAKRPQNAAWQFVVVTLWGVLALPAFELWMRGRGEELAIDLVRSWFFVVMIVIGAVNHFPTRFGLAAAQLALLQIALLWTHLPFGGSSEARPPVWIALGLMLTTAITVRWAANREPRIASVHRGLPSPSWSLVWREFRDWYGTVWGMRMMERINASAATNDWPVQLGWEGFDWRDPAGVQQGGPLDNQLAAQQQAAIEQSLRNLLRRFVSAEWIDLRLESPRQ